MTSLSIGGPVQNGGRLKIRKTGKREWAEREINIKEELHLLKNARKPGRRVKGKVSPKRDF